jgi:CHAD domain-containing protein
MEDAYQRSNAAFRDAARRLGPIRDAHAISDTFGGLLEVAGAHAPDAAAEVGAQLREAANRMSKDEIGVRVADARSLIVDGADLIAHWEVEDARAATKAGIAKTYKRSRKRLRDLEECVETVTLHQWRKRVKYGWYHGRLLRDAAPSILSRQAARLHDVSDALGDDHDLAIIDRLLGDPAGRFGDVDGVQEVRRWLSGWRWDLQRRALSLGSRLLVESPDAHAARMVGYLDVWSEHGPERHAGELTAIASDDD